jgi:uncharacterized delta-60 repeat protein
MRTLLSRLARASSALLAAVALLPAAPAVAVGPGSLDSSFAGGTVWAPAGSQFFGVGVAPGSEVIAAGQMGGDVFVQRYTQAGAPDGSWTGGEGVARAVAVQPNGQVVVAGGAGGMFVERFNANGSLDKNFGSGGEALAGPLGSSAVASSVAIAPDGKVVVAGCVGAGACTRIDNTQIAVARFNANGTLDGSFGSSGNGTEIINLGLPYESAQGVAVQPDGKIVLAGYQQGSPNYAFFNALIMRLTVAGALDPGFNGNGVISWHRSGGAGSGSDIFNAVALQRDGKIVAAGADGGGPYAVLLRVNPNGSLDSSFQSGGETDFSSGKYGIAVPVGAYGVGIAGGGRIAAAGAAEPSGADYRAALWMAAPGGGPDPSFGTAGEVDQSGEVEGCALAIDPVTGNLVMAGGTVSSTASSREPCTNGGGSGYGLTGFVSRYLGFGPPPSGPSSTTSAPVASTATATDVSQVAATLNGQLDTGGLPTTYYFRYGPTSSYGSQTAAVDIPAASGPEVVSAQLGSLQPATTYHYELVASNAAGTSNGGDQSLTTAAPTPPALSTGAAGALTEISARITGRVDPAGLPTTYRFEYGRSPALGSATRPAQISPATGQRAVTATLRRLRPATTYYYRLVATNPDGATYGETVTFATLPRLRARVTGAKRSYRFGSLELRGIVLRVSCNQACSAAGSLILPAAAARRLGLGARAIMIAQGAGHARRAATLTLRLRVIPAGERVLARSLPRLLSSLRVVVDPVGGGSRVSTSRAPTLER